MTRKHSKFRNRLTVPDQHASPRHVSFPLVLALVAGSVIAAEPADDTPAGARAVSGSSAGVQFTDSLEARPVCPACSDDDDYDGVIPFVGVFTAGGALIEADEDSVYFIPASSNPRQFRLTGTGDSNFDGLLDANTTLGHGLFGPIDVYVDYYDVDEEELSGGSHTVFNFVTGREVFSGPINPPAGTFDLDVWTDYETLDTGPCDGSDVDHIIVQGLEPGAMYQVRVLGLANGGLLAFNSSWLPIGESIDEDDPAPTLSLTAANGVLRLAITGANDSDADGLDDDWDCPHETQGQYTVIIDRASSTGCSAADLAPPFGQLDFFDVQAFLDAFVDNDPVADLAAPFGAFNFYDLNAFLNAYSDGCATIPPPVAPAGLTADFPGPGVVRINWQDNASNEDYYQIHLVDVFGEIDQSIAVPRDSHSVQFILEGALNAGASLTATVCAVNASGQGCRDLTVNVPGCDQSPSPLTWNYRRPGSIMLNWIDNCLYETQWRVARSINGDPDFDNIAVLDPNTTQHILSRLQPGTSYTFKVRARSQSGTGPYSNTVTVNVPAAPPTAPTNLSVANLWARALDLCWTDNSNNEAQFRIAMSTDGVNFNNIGVNAANDRCLRVNGLLPNHQYWFKVRAANLAGYSGYTATIHVVTADEPPSTPTNLRLGDADPCSLLVRWDDNAHNESAYRVAISRDGVNFDNVSGNLPANTTAFRIDSLCPQTNYWIKVRAANDAGYSDYSNIIVAATTVLRTPTGLVAARDNNTSAPDVVITWDPPQGCHDAVRLARSTNPNDPNSWNNIGGDLAAGTTVYRDPNVVRGTTYYYKVRLKLNCDGQTFLSDYSNVDGANP